MATFEERIEALTGLTITSSSDPVKQGSITQYLRNSVNDFTNKWLAIHPEDAQLFARSSSLSETNGGLGAGITQLISVVREAGTDNDWRDCAEIPIGLQSRVTDSSSIHFASKYNPVFLKGGDGSIFVYPAPAASENAYKIYYVNNEPVNSSDAALTYSHSDLNYFPASYEYLVVIKASIYALTEYINHITQEDADVTAALTAANAETDEVLAVNDLINTQVDAAVVELNKIAAEIELANA